MSDRRIRSRAATLVALSVLVVVGACAAPPVGGDGVGAGRACSAAARSAPGDGVDKTVLVDGAPVGADDAVAPGALVEITLAWDPASFGGPPLQAVDCVYVDRADGHTVGRGSRLKDLESIEQPLPAAVVSAGRWTTRYTVPSSAAGKLLCDRGRVVGPPTSPASVVGTEATRAAESAPERRILRSDEVCLRVAGGPDPVIPELPVPFLSVLLTLFGVGLVTVRLRRRTA